MSKEEIKEEIERLEKMLKEERNTKWKWASERARASRFRCMLIDDIRELKKKLAILK